MNEKKAEPRRGAAPQTRPTERTRVSHRTTWCVPRSCRPTRAHPSRRYRARFPFPTRDLNEPSPISPSKLSQDPTLEAIKQKRLAELGAQEGGMPQNPDDAQAAQERAEAMQEQRGAALASLMDPKARERLARIALVKPEKAQALENMLLQAAQRGQLGGKVTEDALIGMLEKINGGSGEGGGRGGPKIEMRRRNVMDDDDW